MITGGQDDSTRPGGAQRARRPVLEDETDYEHRHFVNLVAAAFILALALIIGWTIKSFDHRRALERCLESGRKDCIKVVEETVRTFVQLKQ